MESKDSKEVARILVNDLLLDKETASVLKKLKNLSKETYEHSLNVAYITAEILINRYCREYELNQITKGALLHDIGKLNTPEKVLNFGECLSTADRDVIKRHPVDGLKLLDKYFLMGTPKIVKDIVYMHHEKFDGCGYPEGITDIPWYVDLVSTVDAYDAMTAIRCYGKEKSAREALDTLRKEYFTSTYVDNIAQLGDK